MKRLELLLSRNTSGSFGFLTCAFTWRYALAHTFLQLKEVFFLLRAHQFAGGLELQQVVFRLAEFEVVKNISFRSVKT